MSERRSALRALTKTRLLEFIREPEALFWVFAFPILMALVLGFAFRDRPPDPVPVGVLAGPRRPGSLRRSAVPARSSRSPTRIARRGWRPCAPERSRCSSRTPTPSSTTSTRRGPTRAWRASRSTTRSSARAGRLRPGAAARDARPREGLALHRLPASGNPRAEPHGHRDLGHRLLDRQRAPEKDPEAPGRDSDAQVRLPAGADAVALRLPRPRGRRHPGVRRRGLPASRSAARSRSSRSSRSSARCASAGSACSSRRGPARSRPRAG